MCFGVLGVTIPLACTLGIFWSSHMAAIVTALRYYIEVLGVVDIRAGWQWAATSCSILVERRIRALGLDIKYLWHCGYNRCLALGICIIKHVKSLWNLQRYLVVDDDSCLDVAVSLPPVLGLIQVTTDIRFRRKAPPQAAPKLGWNVPRLQGVRAWIRLA
jgi:hypothetical protein